MKCSCAALAALLEALEGKHVHEVDDGQTVGARGVREQLGRDTRRSFERELARCAREVGSTVDEVRDLCAMFPPLEECGGLSAG